MADEAPQSVPRRRRRLWPRYSLGSLLLVMTVLAIWLGYSSDRARRQRRAVESLRLVGADIYYDDCEFTDDPPMVLSLSQLGDESTGRIWRATDVAPRGPSWLRHSLGEDYFQAVIAVSLFDDACENLTAPHVRQIGALNQLRRLRLDYARNLTDESMTHIGRLQQLERLYLNGTGISDEGLSHLAGLQNLRYLGLGYTKITDEGLVSLQGMSKLEMLELSGTEITDAGLKHLRSFKRLKTVYVYRTEVTKEGAKALETLLPGCFVVFSSPGIIG